MRAKDIAVIKELAGDVCKAIPVMTIDGAGQMYRNGKPVPHMEVIAQLSMASAKASELRDIVSRIQPRKAKHNPA